jgi:hypothetical protein
MHLQNITEFAQVLIEGAHQHSIKSFEALSSSIQEPLQFQTCRILHFFVFFSSKQ